MTSPLRLLALLGLGLVTACSPAGSASGIELGALAGGRLRPLELAPGDLRVIVFITHDCPIANAYAPELNRLAESYGEQGVELLLVHTEKGVETPLLEEHAADHGLRAEVALDPEHLLVDALGAEVTPEAFVLQGEDGGFALRYAGRIDDRNVAFGKKRLVAGQHDLREALDALLAGELPAVERTEAVGCYID